MNGKRDIINEKLQSIDHRLDVDTLWTDLESQLPPEPQRRRPLLWLWSCIALCVVIAVVMTIPYAMTNSGNVSESAIGVEHIAAIAQQQGAAETSSRLELGGIPEQSQPIKEAKATTSGTASDATKGRPANEETRVSAKPKTRAEALPGMDSADANTKAPITQSQEPDTDSSTSVTVRANMPRETSQLTVAQDVVTQGSELVSKIVDEEPAQSKRSVDFPYLTNDSRAVVRSVLVTDEPTTPPMAAIIEPAKSRRSPFAVAIVTSYGKDLAGVKSESAMPGNAGFSSSLQHLDVQGLEAQVTYDIGKNWGLATGIRAQRYTDQILSLEEGKTVSTAMADGGFSIREEDYLIKAYNKSDIVDVRLGAYYRLPVSRWLSLRPEVGVGYNITTASQSKSVLADANLANFVSVESSSRTTGWSTYGSLLGEVHVSPRLSVLAGMGYMGRSSIPADDLTESETTRQSILTGQVGLQYRF